MTKKREDLKERKECGTYNQDITTIARLGINQGHGASIGGCSRSLLQGGIFRWVLRMLRRTGPWRWRWRQMWKDSSSSDDRYWALGRDRGFGSPEERQTATNWHGYEGLQGKKTRSREEKDAKSNRSPERCSNDAKREIYPWAGLIGSKRIELGRLDCLFLRSPGSVIGSLGSGQMLKWD